MIYIYVSLILYIYIVINSMDSKTNSRQDEAGHLLSCTSCTSTMLKVKLCAPMARPLNNLRRCRCCVFQTTTWKSHWRYKCYGVGCNRRPITDDAGVYWFVYTNSWKYKGKQTMTLTCFARTHQDEHRMRHPRWAAKKKEKKNRETVR